MKIAFVNDLYERFGAEYISAVLKAGGHQTKLFIDPRLFDDGELSIRWLSKIFDCRNKLISELKAYQPDLIGFSIDTNSYQWALGMTRMIKEAMDVPIILGGIHPTSVPERVILNGSVDMVCVGEGEYAMLELVNSMEKGQIDTTIKNIWFKKNGTVIRNEVRPLIEDLDTLPMPDKALYYSASPHFSECYYIMTSRGCANACSYCCHSYLREIFKNKGKYLRCRSIDSIITELIHAKKKYNIKWVRFWDDDFIAGRNNDWIFEFARTYEKSIGLPFICYLYPQNVSEKSIEYLKNAGCREINVGVQSWEDYIRRNVLHRDTSNQEIEKVLWLLKKYKINAVIDFISGVSLQTDEDAINFLKFCGRWKAGEINFFGIQYFPNTVLTLKMKKDGLFSDFKYENIMEGKNYNLPHMGGDLAFEEIIKFKVVALFIKIFPKRFVEFFIKMNLYKAVSKVLSSRVVEWIYNRSMRSYGRKYCSKLKIRQYIYFIIKKLKTFLDKAS